MKKFEVGESYCVIDEGVHDDLTLEMVWVAPKDRGHGIGTQLVNMAIEYAKEVGKDLGLYAEPQEAGDNGLSTDALIAFYGGLGFESDGDCSELMTYKV